MDKRRIVNIILIVICAALLITGSVLIIREYVLIPGEYNAPGTPAPETLAPASAPAVTVTPSPDAAPSVTPDVTETPMPTETPYVKRIPVRIYFTEHEIMADIQPVGMKDDGSMGTIDSPTIAAWYENGPSPGEDGNALVNGHVRWKGVKGYFSILSELEPEDEIVIEYDDGSFKYFAVKDISYYSYDSVPDEVMYLGGPARMTLISCYGSFNHSAGTSEQRVVAVCFPKVSGPTAE